MKFQGKYSVGCQCHYCVGPNHGGNKVKKKIKHGARQKDRKEERDAVKRIVKNK